MSNQIIKNAISVVVSTLLVGLTACGGGGGSTSSSGGSNPPPPVTGAASVSGTTVDPSSGVGSLSAFKATIAVEGDSTTSALLVLDSNANGEYGDSSDTVLSSVVGSDGSFDFGVVGIDKDKETKAQLTIQKQGFAPYTQILTLTDGQSVSVAVDAASAPLLTEMVNESVLSNLRAAGTLSSSFLEIGTKTSSIGATSYSKIVSLSELKASADVPLDNDIQTKSIIPLAALPDSVTSIKAETQSFDPTNPEDLEQFPGEFVGVGEPGADAQRLVSVGFDYMSLTDQNGDPIELDLNRVSAASKLLPQAVDYTQCVRTSTRTLYGQQLDLFKKFGDDDNTTEEFEIPLWYYNSSAGNWQYLGQAEVYEDSALTKDYNASSSVTTAYAKMCITENWGSHVNLDYSLTPEKPTTVCVVAKDQDGNAISNLQITAKKDTASDTRYLNADGEAQLALTAGGVIGDYSFSYRGTLTGWNITPVQDTNITTGGATGCDNTLNIEVVNPYSATLKVTAKELDGSLASGKYVHVYDSSRSDYYSKSAYTNSDGEAEFKVKPNVNYGVVYRGTTVDANVNGTAVDPEGADNGRIATVTVQEAEVAPVVSLYMQRSSISDTAESVNFYVSTSDENGDAISLKSLTLNGTALVAGTDYNVTNKYSYAGYEYFFAKLNLATATVSAITPQSLTAGGYSLEATYSDGKGDSKASQRFTVSANRAPVISSVYLRDADGTYHYINRKLDAGTYDVSAYAYDPDGDGITLTYTLDSNVTDPTGVGLLDGAHTLIVNATDGALDANKTFEFFVGNSAPEITSFGATSYSIDLASQNRTVKLYAYAKDRDRDTLTVSTTDGNISLSPSYTGSNYFRSTDITIDANTTFTIYANDGDKNSTVKSLDITTYRANRAPVFTAEPKSQQIPTGTSATFTCSATDPEGDTVSYAWYVDDVLQQSQTGTAFEYTFNTSAVVKCTATDLDILEPGVATSSASVTVYDPNASGNLVITTLPGAVVATHDSTTLAPTLTRAAGDDGVVSFAIAGTDRTTFSVSVGPDVVINKEVVFKAELQDLSYILEYQICNESNANKPADCSLYSRETFLAGTSIANKLADLVFAQDTQTQITASDIDTDNNGSIESDELYTQIVSDDDANQDRVLTWSEYMGDSRINSDFFVNVPVRAYNIQLDAYGDGHYFNESFIESNVSLSGFPSNTNVHFSNYGNVYTDTDGNASQSRALYNYSGSETYSYSAHYVDENNATKYYLALDKTATELQNVLLTPADFTLSGTAVSFILSGKDVNNEFLSVNALYNNQVVDSAYAYASSNYNLLTGVLLSDSRLTYAINNSETMYNTVNNLSIYKSTSRYYTEQALKTSYDTADYPYLNIAVSSTADKTVSFSGSDFSKLTTANIQYYSNDINTSVYVRFNYTVIPTSLSMPVVSDILPSVIAASLPVEPTYEGAYVNLTEYKGLDEAGFIDAVTATDYFEYDGGERYIFFNLNFNQSVAPYSASATVKTAPKPRRAKPFSIGFEPRSWIAR